MLETIYILGVLGAFSLYATFAIMVLGIRAYDGIQEYARTGSTSRIGDSWQVFDFHGGNHPVGLALDTALYLVLAAVASLAWMFTVIPAVVAMLGKITRRQYLKAEEANRVMERLSRHGKV